MENFEPKTIREIKFLDKKPVKLRPFSRAMDGEHIDTVYKVFKGMIKEKKKVDRVSEMLANLKFDSVKHFSGL